MRITSLLVVAASLGVLSAQQPQSFTYPQLLARMTDVDWLWQPPVAGERCVQFSSYDRRSDKGPDDFDAWYANDDRGKYLRTEERDGKQEFVMVDVDGPGVLTRIWSANPSGELYFDVDGHRVWTVDFEQLTSGKVEPLGGALAGVRARGANCYLPIPFGKHLKVSASKGDFYYQCNVTTLPAGTRVPSFSPAMLAEHADRLRELARPKVGESGWSAATTMERVRVPAGKVVRNFTVSFEDVPEWEDLGELLRHVLLVVRCGREETVRVPLPDFFCAGADWKKHDSAFLSVADREATCRFPMPMPDGGEVRIVVEGDLGFRIGLGGVGFADLPAAADPLLFRASFHQKKNFDSRPFHDFKILQATGGPGRFVGCSLLVKNPHRGWWGEGDEKFYVDGETFPSTFGTGTEDYFGYAWCSTETFASAFHAQTQCDGPGNYGFTALHRTQILDSVPFQRSFTFDLEVWHWVEGLKMDYASVAYWYGAPGATSGLPPVPPVTERALDRLPPPPVFIAADCLEGEQLRVIEVTGGTHQVQDMSFKGNTFSRDGQRWWRDGKPGDVLTLAVPVPAAGRYRISAAFCQANDYGIVQLALGGQPLGEPFDGFHTAVVSSGALVLGTLELAAGEQPLRIEITGRNDKAVPKHMFGLDYLRLEKLP